MLLVGAERMFECDSRVSEANVFELFSPPLTKALEEKGFVSPTDPQMKLSPFVMSGKNALLMAPTGTGKTEAAFLPILDNIIRNGLAQDQAESSSSTSPRSGPSTGTCSRG